MRQIVTNAGDEASVVVDKVKGLKASEGYNAATGEYGDMIGFGLPDPAKVTQNSASGCWFSCRTHDHYRVYDY